jgi:hypothetical protein
MNTERTETDPNRNPSEAAATHTNGTPPVASREFGRRAKTMFSEFPSGLDAQMKRSPYATLGVAFAVGMGVGILLGSRILRSVAASAVSYGVMELGRAYLRETASPHATS